MNDYEKKLWKEVDDYWNEGNDSTIDNYLRVSDFGGVYQRLKELFPEITIDAIAQIVYGTSYEDYVDNNPNGILDKERTDDDVVLEHLSAGSFKYKTRLIEDNVTELLSLIKKSTDYIAYNDKESPEAIFIYDKKNNKHIGTIVKPTAILYSEVDFEELKRLLTDNESYLEQYNKWNDIEGRKRRREDYIKFSHIPDNEEITKDNLDEQAINQTCFIHYNYPRERLVQELLDPLN